jgi:D-inositol-3-phosphate glycosyltransferase
VERVQRLVVLSMHTSPLAQPGTGDGGGMNVYVRQLCSALARSDVSCEVYTRATSASESPSQWVEPGFLVHHVPAGPLEPVQKEDLYPLVRPFAEAVLDRILASGDQVDAIHANYWLSGVAGHLLKHQLGLPLLSTFHTLERVKAQAGAGAAGRQARTRLEAEVAVIACSDAVLASSPAEATQLTELYDADPDRVVLVTPGVDHTLFTPGSRTLARQALGMPADCPLILFVGRIQPLKRPQVAVSTLAALTDHPDARLAIVGAPSGAEGAATMAELADLARRVGVADRLRMVAPRPHHQLADWYRAADVCLVPSVSESFGLVALEAAACGTPVVASDVGGLASLVETGVNGILVPVGKTDGFAQAVAQILDDPVWAARLGRGGLEVASRHSWETAARWVRQVLDYLARSQLVRCD